MQIQYFHKKINTISKKIAFIQKKLVPLQKNFELIKKLWTYYQHFVCFKIRCKYKLCEIKTKIRIV